MRMKKISRTLVAGLALAVGTIPLQAQWSYYDAVDFAQYTAAYPSAVPNLFVTSGGAPLQATTADGTTEWRYRNSGPGVPDWNGNGYQIRYAEGDVPGYEAISGLLANQQYSVRVYGSYPANTTNSPLPGSIYGAEFGYDNATWTIVDNRGGSTINWVDNSSELGTPVDGTTLTGDTRFWSALPVATTDASGNLNIYLQLPDTLSDGSVPDRFILDGFALQVPEPTTLALAGLGATLLMFIRRRRR